MADAVVAILSIALMLLGAGAAIALIRPGSVDWRWLIASAALVMLNDALLTRGYGTVPRLIPASEWNWQGKLLALAATLVIAALPVVGWRRAGLTWRQARGSLVAAIPVSLLYCAFFLAIALAFPDDPPSPETIAFQLTMPGFEEECFYRGLLLFALDRAFLARRHWLGVAWGWGAILSCVVFGLAHAFGYSDGRYAFDPMIMALTAGPSLIAVWLRLRTGSVALPILLHNFGNAIGLLL